MEHLTTYAYIIRGFNIVPQQSPYSYPYLECGKCYICITQAADNIIVNIMIMLVIAY